VAPAFTVAPGELRASPFLTHNGGETLELVGGARFTLGDDERRLLGAAERGLAPLALAPAERVLAQGLLARRLLLDAAALAEIGAQTLGSLDLEVAGACNAECIFCPREPLKSGRGVGIMSSDVFAAVVDRFAPYARFVGFAGIGEPTLHKDLPALVSAFSRRNIRTALVTNGSLLTDELIASLLEAGIGSMQVSFNGLDRASYEEHMVGLEFGLTLRRVERLVELARDRVPLYISAVATERNQAALAGFVEHWRARGVPAEVVPCHSRGGTVIGLSPRRAAPTPEAPRCGLFNTRAFVSWDGRVLACCHDVDGKSEIGHVTVDSAETLIARKLEVMRGSEWFPVCAGCDEPARLQQLSFAPRAL
jgi:hypothetical protein